MQKGMTLIEIVIYTFLISFLMAGFIRYAYSINLGNIQLIHDIEDAQNK